MAMPVSRCPRSVRRLVGYSACLSALLVVAGCTMPANVREGNLKGKQFEVSESSLNWAEIVYTPRPRDPVFRAPCRLTLFGSGEIVFRTGRSPRVIDDFSQKVTSPDWNDYVEDRAHIGDKAMRDVFQQLVDAGVFYDDWHRVSKGEDPKPPMVRVRAKFDGKETLRVVDNRRVVRIVERILDDYFAR